MEAIVAVFSDWGIGSEGTQQVVLTADRKPQAFFCTQRDLRFNFGGYVLRADGVFHHSVGELGQKPVGISAVFRLNGTVFGTHTDIRRADGNLYPLGIGRKKQD